MRHLLAAILFALSMFSLPTAAQSPRYLISASPMTDAPSGIQAWRVQYWTTNGSGQRFAVTGIVAASMEAIPPRPRRVIALTHGAWGVAEKRSEEHTSELQSLMRISYAVFCLKKKKKHKATHQISLTQDSHQHK